MRGARPSSFVDDGVGIRNHRLFSTPCGDSAEDLERLLRRQALATRVFLQQLPHGVREQRGVRPELTEQLIPKDVPGLASGLGSRLGSELGLALRLG